MSLVHAEAAGVDVAHVVADDARLADLVAGDGAGEAAHRGGGGGGQGGRVGEQRREDGRACKSSGSLSPRLPVGDRQIYTWYLFGPSGLKDYGSATLKNLIPAQFDCAPTPSILAQSKERKESNFAIWQVATLSSTLITGSRMG